ncbi:NADH-quinone oxidoreductase subunit N [Flavobacterium rhizosphaerae]|uniref:NADH-quinone oxidoreductase subunit N n=1 Tax=Flavobacterium rhizosphaerae TaxID=3163298 RepID=A0ABW8YUY3_9FLAO
MDLLIAIAGLGIICLIAEIFNGRKAIVPITLAGLIAILGYAGYKAYGVVTGTNTGFGLNEQQYFNMVVSDRYAVSFSTLFILLTIFLVALSYDFHKKHSQKLSDFIAIKLFLLTGAVAMVSFGNLAMFFLGIEILSIALYVLAGSEPKNVKSNEAGMKYFLMGAFASGVILFGIALIYGATGSFNTAEIFAASATELPVWFTIGIVLLTVGLLFKIAAVPFHFWAPDVYEGAPTLSTATMATLAKVAAVAAFFRLMKSMNHEVSGAYIVVITIAIVLSMTVGNLLALRQDNVKRMLAYSGISHAGFMLMIFLNPTFADGTLLYYASAYSLAGIAAFSVVIFVCTNKDNEKIYNFNGLGKSNPAMAAVLTCALLSMAGIPIFSGFFAKFFLFQQTLSRGHVALVIIAVINSIVSVGYYFKLILAMYTKDSTEETQPAPVLYKAVAIISILITIGLGLYPDLVHNFFFIR